MFGIGLNLWTTTIGVEEQIPFAWTVIPSSNFLLYLENDSDLLLMENSTDTLIAETNILLYIEDSVDLLLMENNSSAILQETYIQAN